MSKKRPEPGKSIEKEPDKLAVLLLRYAYAYAASVGWRAHDCAIARGQGMEDIAQDALASLYDATSERPWDREKHPDPMDHLKSFVNSRLSTLTRSYEFRNVIRSVEHDRCTDPEHSESILIKRELDESQGAWRERARDLLHEEILNDDLLMRMHDVMEKEDIDKPSELAERLNTSLEEIKNAKKRFKRAWLRVIDTLGPEPCGKEVAHG